MTAQRCTDHAALADELRDYITGTLNLIEPWIEQVRERHPESGAANPTGAASEGAGVGGAAASADQAGCTACPLCAVLTVLRGGRSDLAARMAEQASGLVAILRTALDEGIGRGAASSSPPEPGAPPGSADPAPSDEHRDVQRIQVNRGGGGAAHSRC